MEPHSEFANQYKASFDQARQLLHTAVREADDEIVEEWIRQGRRMQSVADLLNPSGCSLDQIEQVREAWSGWMPASFQAFLEVMGNMQRHVDVGVNCYFPALLEAPAAFEDWQSEMARHKPERHQAGDYSAPDSAIPIGHHEGYKFAFFVDRSDDPSLFWLREGAAEAARTDEISFSVRITEAITRQAAAEIKRLRLVAKRRELS